MGLSVVSLSVSINSLSYFICTHVLCMCGKRFGLGFQRLCGLWYAIVKRGDFSSRNKNKVPHLLIVFLTFPIVKDGTKVNF